MPHDEFLAGGVLLKQFSSAAAVLRDDAPAIVASWR
jgi:hypothetical protein